MELHYSIYGEQNKGHSLLGSSGNTELSTKLTGLTDRPGDPPVGTTWGPVLSGFVFGGHYIFLQMAPDPTVKRAGMVRTYAIHIPLADIGRVNNLPLLFSALHSISGTNLNLKPLQIEDNRLFAKSSDPAVPGCFSFVKYLCAADTKFPILWNSPESYLPAISLVWGNLPVGLRKSFSFLFLFAPEYHTDFTPTLVATLPELAGRWSGNPIIKTEEQGDPLATHLWLGGSLDGSVFTEILDKFSIDLSQFTRIGLVGSFVEMISRLDVLNFSEARKAVNIVAKYSVNTHVSRDHRAHLFAKFCELTSNATSEELLMLRNLDAPALADLVPSLQLSVEQAFGKELQKKTLSLSDFELVQEAAKATTEWWSESLRKTFGHIVRNINKSNLEILLRVGLSPISFDFATQQLPLTKEYETHILELMPDHVAAPSAENLANLASKRKWSRLLALCLSKAFPPEQAISKYLTEGIVTEDGLARLEVALGAKALIHVAVIGGDAKLLPFIGRIIAKDVDIFLSAVPEGCVFESRILSQVVISGRGMVKDPLRNRVINLLGGTVSEGSDVLGLGECSILRDPSLLLELQHLIPFLNAFAGDVRRDLEQKFENWIKGELLSIRVLNPSFLEPFIQWAEQRNVASWLNDETLNDSAVFGLKMFRVFPFLTDADCRVWLIKLFTHTQYAGLDSVSSGLIANFLTENYFPESAKIVKETALNFCRSDVVPVHEKIRYKYQMAQAYPRPISTSTTMHKVLIVTAIPIERSEIIHYLPNATYDVNLETDVGSYPNENPVYEIYVATCGPGNIAALSSVNRFLQKGVKPTLAFFVGVGGGIKDSDIGDVIYSTKVYYTEGGKETDTGVKVRPAMKETTDALVQIAIRCADKKWQPSTTSPTDKLPKATPGVIAASEQVLASRELNAQSFQRIKDSFNDTQVVDMEAYGFLKAVQDGDIKYSMVLRGISDTIDKKEASDAQGNQPLAAKNVAAFLFQLLEECRPLIEKKKTSKKKGIIRRFFG